MREWMSRKVIRSKEALRSSASRKADAQDPLKHLRSSKPFEELSAGVTLSPAPSHLNAKLTAPESGVMTNRQCLYVTRTLGMDGGYS